MTVRNKSNKSIGTGLVEIGAIKLQPNKPFTWSSGWKSPIYCDNRRALSYPSLRESIVRAFVDCIRDEYPNTEGIGGVATGGIAYGALVADCLNLPFVYIRSAAKGHGKKNRIEGDINEACDYVLIEDLISTGGSSISAVKAMREDGLNVLSVISIMNYNFEVAADNFKNAQCDWMSLVHYADLIDFPEMSKSLNNEEKEVLASWRLSPSSWTGTTKK